MKIKLDTLTVALILSGLALSITLGFTSGWVTSIAVQEGGLVDAIARMAQIVPGTHTVETDSDIPAATDLTPLKTFWKARQRVLQGYVYPDEIDDAELTYGAIRGMLNALGDPYTRFMDPDQYKDFRTESTGHFEGIGAMLMMEVNDASGEKEVVVSSVLPEGPAATTDLAADDVILAVDERPIKGMALNEVVDLIRGPGGTPVVLTVRHKGAEELSEVEIIRGRVEFPIIESKMLDDEIGYIWLRSFNRMAEVDMRKALSELEEQGMKALLLDLSMDPGGMLDQAVAVSSLFLDDTPITFIKDRNGEPDPLMAHPGVAVAADVPIVALIDGGSASASEIVAGALQDTGRGTIVGHPSFGKAKVQTVIELDDGSAVVLTTAVYLTPLKRDISKGENGERGVQPDIRFPDPVEPEERDPELTYRDWFKQWHGEQIERAAEVLREKLAG